MKPNMNKQNPPSSHESYGPDDSEHRTKKDEVRNKLPRTECPEEYSCRSIRFFVESSPVHIASRRGRKRQRIEKVEKGRRAPLKEGDWVQKIDQWGENERERKVERKWSTHKFLTGAERKSRRRGKGSSDELVSVEISSSINDCTWIKAVVLSDAFLSLDQSTFSDLGKQRIAHRCLQGYLYLHSLSWEAFTLIKIMRKRVKTSKPRRN